MISKNREIELDLIISKCRIVNEHYYLLMSQDEFDKEMKGIENDAFYTASSLQRKIGFRRFKEDLILLIKNIDSAEELHYLAYNYNYDDDAFLLYQIIENPHCNISTARMIYWLSIPTYYYDKYGLPENCDEDYNRQISDLIVKIENTARNNGFLETNSIKLSDDVFAMMSNEKVLYQKYPYNRIPQSLRIEGNSLDNEFDNFLRLDRANKIEYLNKLHYQNENYRIIIFLLEYGLDNLDVEFLGMLARAYNNNNELTKALSVLDKIPEDKRDAIWYYRVGYAWIYNKNKLKALESFEKAIQLAINDKVIKDCLDLININLNINKDFINLIKGSFPLIYKYYSNDVK